MKKILLLSFTLLFLFACKKENTTTVFDHTYWKGAYTGGIYHFAGTHHKKLVFTTEGLCTEYTLDTLTGKYSIIYLKFYANGKNATLIKDGETYATLQYYDAEWCEDGKFSVLYSPDYPYSLGNSINIGLPIPIYFKKYNFDETIDTNKTFLFY